MDSLAHWRNSESLKSHPNASNIRGTNINYSVFNIFQTDMKNSINWITLYISLMFNWYGTSILVQLNHAIYPGFQFFLLTEINFRDSTLTTHVLPLKGYQILCDQTHSFGKLFTISKWCIWQLVLYLQSQQMIFTEYPKTSDSSEADDLDVGDSLQSRLTYGTLRI